MKKKIDTPQKVQQSHKRALKAAKRRKAFKAIKHQLNLEYLGK